MVRACCLDFCPVIPARERRRRRTRTSKTRAWESERLKPKKEEKEDEHSPPSGLGDRPDREESFDLSLFLSRCLRTFESSGARRDEGSLAALPTKRAFYADEGKN